MKYVSCVNELFRSEIDKLDEFVLYGQNVSAGSCLGGLTRDLEKSKGCSVFNVPNTENTLVGMGFGLMLSGTSSAYFMKQQDFLLLGIDQLTNTNNFVRQHAPAASFTIVCIAMDAGYEGIQSSLNNLPDFCAIANCKGYTISSKQDAELIIGQCFTKPGFRLISVSQRLFATEMLDIRNATAVDDEFILRYREGKSATIACSNFSLPQGKKLCDQFAQYGLDTSLYGITAAHPGSYDSIVDDAKNAGRLLIIDDSKSYSSANALLELGALRAGVGIVKVVKRRITEDSYRPHSEIFDLDIADVAQQLNLPLQVTKV